VTDVLVGAIAAGAVFALGFLVGWTAAGK